MDFNHIDKICNKAVVFEFELEARNWLFVVDERPRDAVVRGGHLHLPNRFRRNGICTSTIEVVGSRLYLRRRRGEGIRGPPRIALRVLFRRTLRG